MLFIRVIPTKDWLFFYIQKKFLELLHNRVIPPANTLIEEQITGGIITMINKAMKKHTNTKRYTRAALISWKHSIKKAQKQCYVTGSTESLEIHHLNKPFSEMFKEAHKILGIQYHEEVKDYAESDLDALTDLVVDMHKDVTALVLQKDIHKALHDTYGLNFTMDQVNEFKKNYHKRKTAINK